MTKTCCFTGHRPNKLPWGKDENQSCCRRFKFELRDILERKIRYEKYSHFITGMAMGIDMIAAEMIIKLKKKHNITLEAAIPCEEQYRGWFKPYVDRYKAILEQCDKITYIKKHYTLDCMKKRNQYMVNSSDLVIAVWNKDPHSGTAQTINYAKLIDKKILILDVNLIAKNPINEIFPINGGVPISSCFPDDDHQD